MTSDEQAARRALILDLYRLKGAKAAAAELGITPARVHQVKELERGRAERKAAWKRKIADQEAQFIEVRAHRDELQLIAGNLNCMRVLKSAADLEWREGHEQDYYLEWIEAHGKPPLPAQVGNNCREKMK